MDATHLFLLALLDPTFREIRTVTTGFCSSNDLFTLLRLHLGLTSLLDHLRFPSNILHISLIHTPYMPTPTLILMYIVTLIILREE